MTSYTILREAQEIDPSKWAALLESSPYSSPFQAPEFFRFCAAQQNQDPFVVVVARGEEYAGLASGVIYREPGLKSRFSSRAILEGGLVLTGDDQPGVIAALLRGLDATLSRKVIYAEIRNYHDYEAFRPAFTAHGYRYLPYLNFQVDCSDAAEMKRRVSKSKMRQIAGSLKEGAAIVRATEEGQVKEFYAILHDLYRQKVKRPLPAWEFFRSYFHSGNGVFLLVTFQGRVVGGIMCPYDRRAIFEWYVAGLDQQFDRVYPSALATWAAMDFAAGSGIPRFDFMGAGMAGKDYGVREFKARFGGEMVEHGRFRKVYRPLLFKIGETGINLLSKMK